MVNMPSKNLPKVEPKKISKETNPLDIDLLSEDGLTSVEEPTQSKIGLKKPAGWKEKLAEKKQKIMPRVLKSKLETWDTIKPSQEKREKGIVLLIFAMHKVGKTHFAMTAAESDKPFIGKYRTIPPASPVYIIDSEAADEDELDAKFSKLREKIHIKECYVEGENGVIDPIKSMEAMEEWAYALRDEQRGTIVIDTITDYCEFAYYKLVNVLGPKYGFDENGVEIKKLAPIQYKWRTKQIVTFLRNLRKFKMNVILIAQGKPEYDQGDSVMESKKTGKIIADAIEKVGFWVDAIAVMDKTVDDQGILRRLVVTDSRFETNDQSEMKAVNYTLENDQITFGNLLNLFKKVI